MGTIVFILLPIGLLVGAGVAVGVFFETAFAGPKRATVFGHRSRLPLLSGGDLRRWASQEAARIVQRFVRRPMDAAAPVAAAHAVEQFTSDVIDDSLSKHRGPSDDRCDERKRELIGVTAPEALAIVDKLRRRMSRRALANVRETAVANAERLSACDDRCLCCELPACPLLAANGCCECFDSRPVQCRGKFAMSAEPESSEGLSAAAFAAAVRQGVSAGLSAELMLLNLGGERYELNAAVGRALGIPDAAARWARGEAIFDGCRLVAS